MERCKTHRFSTYWLHINEPTENAKALIFRRKAETIKINNANEFFYDLEEKLESLTDLSLRNQHLSIEMARSTLKRWVPDTKNHIKIHDMITDEARLVISVCDKKPVKKSSIETVDIHFLEDSMKKLANLIIILCYYSKSSYENIIIDTLDILTKQNNKTDEWGKWDYYYPASIYICSVLLGCVRTENYNLLYKILNHKFKKRNNDSDIEPDDPISIHLYFHHADKYRDVFYEYFKNPMKEFVADELHYDQLFDKAKSIFAMYFRDIKVYDHSIKLHSLYQNLKEIFSRDLKEGSKCTLLQSGFFGGDFERFRECMNHIKIENPFY